MTRFYCLDGTMAQVRYKLTTMLYCPNGWSDMGSHTEGNMTIMFLDRQIDFKVTIVPQPNRPRCDISFETESDCWLAKAALDTLDQMVGLQRLTDGSIRLYYEPPVQKAMFQKKRLRRPFMRR